MIDEEKQEELNRELGLAVMDGDLKKVKLLLSKGADLNYRDDEGFTALMLSITNERSDIFRYLLDQGADVNIEDGDNFTALTHSLDYNDIEATRSLLAHGADVNYDGRDNSPLMTAIENGDLDVMRLLLEYKPNLEYQNSSGFTALIFAAFESNAEAVCLLLEHNADVNAKDNDQWTALDHANDDDCLEIVSLLEANYQKNYFDQQKLEKMISENENQLAVEMRF